MISPGDVRQLIRLATSRTGTPVFDEDLAQEACMRALDAFQRVGHVEHPRAFLMKVVCDTVRDHWRRRRPFPEDIEEVDERLMCISPKYEDEIDRARRMQALRSALASLAPAKRRVLEMHYMEDLSVPQIAQRLNKSKSAVKMDLLRARRRLAKILKHRDK